MSKNFILELQHCFTLSKVLWVHSKYFLTVLKNFRRESQFCLAVSEFLWVESKFCLRAKSFAARIKFLSNGVQRLVMGTTFFPNFKNVVSRVCLKEWKTVWVVLSFCPTMSKELEVNYTFVSRCQKFSPVKPIFVPQFRKTCGENHKFFSRREFFLSWINVLSHSTVIFAAEITFMSNSVKKPMGCTTVSSQLSKGWVERHTFA